MRLQSGSFLIRVRGNPLTLKGLPRDVSFDRYTHNREAFLWIKRGSVRVYASGVIFRVGEGEEFIFPPHLAITVRKVNVRGGPKQIWPPILPLHVTDSAYL